MKKFQLCRKMIYDPSHHLYSISTYINGNLAMQAKQTVAQSTPPRSHKAFSQSPTSEASGRNRECSKLYQKLYAKTIMTHIQEQILI